MKQNEEERKYSDNYSFNIKNCSWKQRNEICISPNYDIITSQVDQMKDEIIKQIKTNSSVDELEYVGYLLFKDNNMEQYWENNRLISGYIKTKYPSIFKTISRKYELNCRKNLVGLLLNKIYNDVNNIPFTFIPKIVEDKYLISTNEMYFNNFNTYLKYPDIGLDIIINIFLQIVLCLNSINQHYEYSHNDLYSKRLMIQELSKEKNLKYNVLLNGN